MGNNYVFAIDCDEVIRPLIRNMVDVYNHAFGTKMKYEDVQDFSCNVSFPLAAPNAPEWFFEDNADIVYNLRPPIEGSVEAIKKLRKYGKVIIATCQKSTKNKIMTLKWLDKYGIEYDDIYFGDNKKLINCDYFIDDNPIYFIGSRAKNGIFITASYNKNINLQELKIQSRCHRISRYDSIEDFADAFIYEHLF